MPSVTDTICITMHKPSHVLREYRQKHGLSCADVGKLLGIAEPTARSLENGNRRITPEMAVEIEKALGIPRQKLVPDLFESRRQSDPHPEAG